MQLTVYFDADCPLCRRIACWLDRQPKFVPLHCVALQSEAAAACRIDPDQLLDELTVTASNGAVYRGTKAWLMCLWALRSYRGWALSLSTESLWLAKRLFAAITRMASLTKGRPSRS